MLILLSAFVEQPSGGSSIRWVISHGGSLKVVGSTNVNNFSCSIMNYSRPDTLSVYRTSNNVRMTGNVQLDVEDFDCHNLVMTADLRKTLKAKQHPRLGIKFLNLNKFPGANQQNVKGMVIIELAGVARQFEVNYTIVPGERQTITLTGSRDIKFSDFNIVPPRKLGGMIQTNDELKVEFKLRLKALD
ncbi:MAG: hypothetical protein K0S09_2859 [Sphingobacteriaceae bacterium]|jgi:hypothetical protein|nr:hypothetical protein [Sphingobacteriaceae bacterium]